MEYPSSRAQVLSATVEALKAAQHAARLHAQDRLNAWLGSASSMARLFSYSGDYGRELYRRMATDMRDPDSKLRLALTRREALDIRYALMEDSLMPLLRSIQGWVESWNHQHSDDKGFPWPVEVIELDHPTRGTIYVVGMPSETS